MEYNNNLHSDSLTKSITSLPIEIKWRILSYLPYVSLSQLHLSNKDAWMIFNSNRTKSLPFNDNLDWLCMMNMITLKVKEQLFVMTLADLHYHTTNVQAHQCFSLFPSMDSTFRLIPLIDKEGFILLNAKCEGIPWSKRFSLSEHYDLTEVVFTQNAIPHWSPVYSFLQRELSRDEDVQRFFGFCNAKEGVGEDAEFENLVMHYTNCSECSQVSDSDDDDDADFVIPDDYIDSSSSDSDMEVDLQELLTLRKDLCEFESESYEKECEKHRDKILKSIRKRYPRKQGNPKKLKRTKYCPDYNNNGYCRFGSACVSLHKIAPVCKFDQNCTQRKCGFYHNPKRSAQTLSRSLKTLDDEIERQRKERAKRKKRPRSSRLSSDTNSSIKVVDDSIEDSSNILQDLTSREERHLCSTLSSLDIHEVDSDEAEMESEDERLWTNFCEDIRSRSRSKFRNDEAKEKLQHIKRKYKENHPLPYSWNKEIPMNCGLSLVFLLTEHPVVVDNIYIKNKRQRGNCLTWDVFEGDFNGVSEDFLGIAVMPLTRTGVPVVPETQHYYRALPSIFGERELLGVGHYNYDYDETGPRVIDLRDVPDYISIS